MSPRGVGAALTLRAIAVSNASQLQNQVTNTVVAGTTFSFVPSSAGQYLLKIRAVIGNRALNWGSVLTVSAGSTGPAIQIASNPVVSGSQAQIDFTLANYNSGMTFQLLKSTDISSGWVQDTSASLQTLVSNSKFRFATPTGGALHAFDRVVGN